MKVMKARTRITVTLILAAMAAGTNSALAQDTRAEEIRRQQSDRLQQLTPPRASMFERALDRLDRWGFISGPPRGVYPWTGAIYPGSGFAAGAGVRQPFGDDGAVNVFGGYS